MADSRSNAMRTMSDDGVHHTESRGSIWGALLALVVFLAIGYFFANMDDIGLAVQNLL